MPVPVVRLLPAMATPLVVVVPVVVGSVKVFVVPVNVFAAFFSGTLAESRASASVPVMVEVQLRTIAMDFWASLEHKIHYKYRGAVPDDLLDGLREAAESAHALDTRMESLHAEVKSLDVDGVSTLPEDIRSDLVTGDDLEPSAALLEQLRRLGDDD